MSMLAICVPDSATCHDIFSRHVAALAVVRQAVANSALAEDQRAAAQSFIAAVESVLSVPEFSIHLHNRRNDLDRVARLLPKPASPPRIPAPEPEPSKAKPPVAARGKAA